MELIRFNQSHFNSLYEYENFVKVEGITKML